jgi:parallel beta-helix repeat protein
MGSVAAPAPRGHVLGAVALVAASAFLLFSAPASPNGNGKARCGKVITRSFTLTHNLLECRGPGLVVGANGITINLNGKTIDGVSSAAGIRNDGFDRVTIKNGRIQQFNYGVKLGKGTQRNLLTGLTLSGSEYAGVLFANADRKNRVVRNVIELQSGEGVAIVNGSWGNVVSRNKIRNNESNGVFVEKSYGNLIARNRISHNSDRNIRMDKASRNAVLRNTLSRSGDAAVELTSSNSNALAWNAVSVSGDAAFILTKSSVNLLLGNKATSSSDAGAFLQYSHGNTLRGNAFTGNPAGIDLAHSNANVVDSNLANANTGNGINLEDSNNNRIRRNQANGNGGTGIYVVSEAFEHDEKRVPGNVITGNSANLNGGGGLEIASAGHTLRGNRAFRNGGWGIYTVEGTIIGAGNCANGNAEFAQCYGVVCLLQVHVPVRKARRQPRPRKD